MAGWEPGGSETREVREDLARLALAGFGQVKVNQGGLERGVPEILADQADGDSGVEKVRGEAMAQGVAGDRAMPGPPIPAQGKDGGAHGGLHRGIAHRFGGAPQGIGQGGAGALPAAPRRGEEPLGIAVALPEGAQPLDEFRGNGNLAIPAALGPDDADDAARGVNVAGLEMDGLIQAARMRPSTFGLRFASSKTPPSLGVFRRGAGRSGT